MRGGGTGPTGLRPPWERGRPLWGHPRAVWEGTWGGGEDTARTPRVPPIVSHCSHVGGALGVLGRGRGHRAQPPEVGAAPTGAAGGGTVPCPPPPPAVPQFPHSWSPRGNGLGAAGGASPSPRWVLSPPQPPPQPRAWLGGGSVMGGGGAAQSGASPEVRVCRCERGGTRVCALTVLGAPPCVLTRVWAHQLGGGTCVCACPQRARGHDPTRVPHAHGEPVPSAALGAKARPALHTRVPPPRDPPAVPAGPGPHPAAAPRR